MNASVVIGYDKSPNSDRALAEAAKEAVARGTSLTIVHAYHWLAPITAIAPPTDNAEKACREAAQQVVEDAAATIRSRHPGLGVETVTAGKSAASALIEASHGAALVLVGSRGHGGFTGLLLGSVSMRVLAGAACPVIVVRGDSRPTEDRIVAAVDIDGPCEEVLEYAFTTAGRFGAGLTVLHVWDEPWFLTQGSAGAAQDITAVEADRAARLDALVQPWQAKFPEVDAQCLLRDGAVGALIVEASVTADLLVAGGRRNRDGEPGVTVGPVASTALHHSACPVAIVPVG